MQRIRKQLLAGLLQLLIGSTTSLDTYPMLQDFPRYEIRPQSENAPEILVLNLGNGQLGDVEEFTGALVRPPTAEFDAFHGSERDFRPSFELSQYRDPYVEDPPPSRRPLVVDWSQYRFRTMGNYDLLRDDETGMLLLYSTLRRVVDGGRSVEQLDDYLQTNGDVGRRVRRKRDLDLQGDEDQTQFMPNFLSKYLTLILVRLRSERWIEKVWV